MPLSPPSAKAAAGRLTYLDGLRGIAAFAVVLDHIAIFIPGFVYDDPLRHGPFADLALQTLHFPVRAGAFAVFIFFVLSGFVIAKSAARVSEPLPLRTLRRYIRLTVPMVISTILSWALLELFPGSTRAAGVMLHSQWVGNLYAGATPSFLYAAADGLWGTYLSGSSYLDPVLWSMRVELIGSLGLYAIYAAAPQRYRPALLIATALLLLALAKSVYLGFPFGALLFELWQLNRLRPSPRLGTAAIIVGLLLGPIGQSNLFAPAVQWFTHHLGGRWTPLGAFYSVGELFIVAGVIVTPLAGSALRLRGAEFLGRISYGLYLTHMPILMTAFAALYVALGAGGSVPRIAAWVVLFLPTAIFAAWLLTRLVDEPIVKSLKKLRLPVRFRPIRPQAADPAPLG